jgi:hypothetical protein
MFRLSRLVFLVLLSLILSGLCFSQDAAPFPVRMERQTRQENVCMLVQKDGHFHLERTSTGSARVFIGTLDSSAVSELEPLLNANHLADLRQSQIESTPPGSDIDQVMITIARSQGRQTLTFASSKSRKPFKGEIDPILGWLDRYKQQQNPIDATPSRCVTMDMAKAGVAGTNANPTNPYMLRIVSDRYESTRSGTTSSLNKGTAGEMVGGSTATPAMDQNAFKITRTCAIVYDSGKYRFERSVRDAGILTKSEVFRDTLDKTQLAALREALDNPKLEALPNNSAPGYFAREGEVISMAVPRDKGVQSIVVASFAPRPASADLREVAYNALMANLGLTNPVRKWVKQSIEDHKGAPAKETPSTNCIPSPQPE